MRQDATDDRPASAENRRWSPALVPVGLARPAAALDECAPVLFVRRGAHHRGARGGIRRRAHVLRANEFSGRAADRRAAAEAGSLAELAGRMATADAFNGYIELLRYADDPTVRDRG